VPGEFTACLPDNALLREGTTETVVVPHPDGDMTLLRQRGETWSGAITATDARFSGTHYFVWTNNQYTLPSGAETPRAVAEGHRIENDEGAWQGWSVGAGLSDDAATFGVDRYRSPVFLTGEGAYEGLSAILFPQEASGCFFSFRGVPLEFPEPPVPATSG
jgi:hypothetical protein